MFLKGPVDSCPSSRRIATTRKKKNSRKWRPARSYWPRGNAHTQRRSTPRCGVLFKVGKSQRGGVRHSDLHATPWRGRRQGSICRGRGRGEGAAALIRALLWGRPRKTHETVNSKYVNSSDFQGKTRSVRGPSPSRQLIGVFLSLSLLRARSPSLMNLSSGCWWLNLRAIYAHSPPPLPTVSWQV